jgi:hypothetical protein
LAPDAPIELRRYPEHRSFFATLFGAMGASARVAHTLSLVAATFDLQPSSKVFDAARRARALERNRIQSIAPPIEIH